VIVQRSQSQGHDQARISVVMAIHNRRELTLRAVKLCASAAAAYGIRVSFFIFDDGSTDGSADALRAQVAEPLHVITGDGSAFWAKAMSLAERAALEDDSADYILWLNDDVSLRDDSLRVLLDEARRRGDAIIVGAMKDPKTALISYSGYMRMRGCNPLRLRMVEKIGSSMEIDTLHGNCVLVPMRIARLMGEIDGGFSHGWADIDYGFRARRLGISVVLAARVVGECAPNRVRFTGATVRDEWRSYLSTKGAGNYQSLRRILQRHAGWRWPALIAQSYALWWIRAVPRAVSRRRAGLRVGRVR